MLQLNPSLWLCLLLQLRFLIPLHPNIIEAEALIGGFGSLPPPLWNLLGFFLWSKGGEPRGSALQAGDRAWAWWDPGGPPLALGIPFLIWPLFSCCLPWLFGLLCYKLQANTRVWWMEILFASSQFGQKMAKLCYSATEQLRRKL